VTLTLDPHCIIAIVVAVNRASNPEQVQFSGEIRGESKMQSEVDIGSQIIHTFQVVGISVFSRLFYLGCPHSSRSVVLFTGLVRILEKYGKFWNLM